MAGSDGDPFDDSARTLPDGGTAATGDETASTATERASTGTVLEVTDLQKEFEGVVALDGADVEVREGEIVTLIGPNGAGKTTLFNCVMGTLAPTGGRVTLRGDDITGLKTSDIVKRGLSRTFQIPRVFPELTVRENMIANQNHRNESMLRTLYAATDAATDARIDELLSFVDLAAEADEPAGDISTGQQKLLNLATTLLRDPDVIMLDEPTAGVNPALIDDITDKLLRLNREGRTFLVIEHNMDVVRKITDYVYVLDSGTNLVDGQPGPTLSDDRVLEAYFGE
jgi:branched-chain amino acid transport system ATP-binding protein